MVSRPYRTRAARTSVWSGIRRCGRTARAAAGLPPRFPNQDRYRDVRLAAGLGRPKLEETLRDPVTHREAT